MSMDVQAPLALSGKVTITLGTLRTFLDTITFTIVYVVLEEDAQNMSR